MPNNGSKKILAVLDDLFFTVKIADAAKRAGLELEVLKNEKEVFEKAKEHPMLIIVDLNGNSVQPLKLLTKLKSHSETKQVRVIGFVSHVQGELKQKAHETGCDMVLARSAFSQNLPMLLKRQSGGV
jgi:PleD family two-component response regulator